MSGPAGDPWLEAIEGLRTAVIQRLCGNAVGSDRLIRLGLDALLAGVDSPSLALLAGLTRAEEPEAAELFERVTQDLGLAPGTLPDLPAARDWALIRWWMTLMLDGVLSVRRAGELVYWRIQPFAHGGDEDARRLLSAIVIHEDAVTSWAIWDDGYAARCGEAESDVLEAARKLVARDPPEQQHRSC